MTHPASSFQLPASRGVLGLITSQFPRYDEAFILRELMALGQGDSALVIFSLRPCRDQVIHEQAKALMPRTVYAPFIWSAALWRSHAAFLWRAPRAYAGALGWIVSRHWAHPVILMKTLILFPKIVHFAQVAQARGVTHLHAFWATYPASAALLMSRLTGIPFSQSGHAHDIYTANPTLAEKLHVARFTLTCTKENERYLQGLVQTSGCADVQACGQNGNSARQHVSTSARPSIVVSYHGVDLARFAPIPKSTDGVCRLLAVGSLFACKGYETLIEACAALARAGVTFECTIAGGGPLARKLLRLISHRQLASRVRLTGYVSQDRVAALYQQAHLVVLPLVSKIHWGIPNVLIEALATKTPVIACDLPSMRELVEHDRSGWIIPEGNPLALAQAVQQLWVDGARRQRLADAGYQRVLERFSLNQTGEALCRLFANPDVAAMGETGSWKLEAGTRTVLPASSFQPPASRASSVK